MSKSEILDKALREADEWLSTVGGELKTSNDRSALAALRAGLHVVRDSVPVGNAVKVGNCLPVLIRGVYYEGWNPKGAPAEATASGDLLKGAAHDIRGHEELPSAEKTLQASFVALNRLLQSDALEPVLGALPPEIRELWPKQAKAASAGPSVG